MEKENLQSHSPEYELEANIMLFMRNVLERDMGYNLTPGDAAWIRNNAPKVIADIKQHEEDIEDAWRKKDRARAQNIAAMMPASYEAETLERFLNERFEGLALEELVENYKDKERGEFLKRIRDGQEYL